MATVPAPRRGEILLVDFDRVVGAEIRVEQRRLTIQATLDARKSAAQRNRLGQFATPNTLAIEIARNVQSVADRRLRAIRFADPAIGTGSFYSAMLAVFGPERIESAVGVELDCSVRECTGLFGRARVSQNATGAGAHRRVHLRGHDPQAGRA